MMINIPFEECLKDSPKFRSSLEEAENDVDLLENKLEKLVKQCSGMIEAGKAYNNANKSFITSVKDVTALFKKDDFVKTALGRFTNVLAEIQKYRAIVLDQAQRSVCSGISSFIKSEISTVKDSRRHFEKISGDMDQALVKHAQSPKSRPQECDESNNVLTAMKSCFGHTSLDYVFQMKILHSKKRFDILDTMLSYMNAQNTFFHQGSDMFADLETYTKELETLRTQVEQERKNMEERHLLVQQQKDLTSLPAVLGESDSEEDHTHHIEGYLFKRTSNAFKSWVRRWFVIDKTRLVYRKRTRDSLTVMEDDLRLCIAKPLHDIDRRFCFELISPKSTHILQADSEWETQRWLTAVQIGASKAYNRHSSEPSQLVTAVSDTSLDYMSEETSDNTSSPAAPDTSRSQSTSQSTWQPTSLSRMQQVLAIPGNGQCCDCGSADPRWASINFGITLCIECSGIHRSLGVHLSKVRSVTLDAWDPEQLKVFAELGNVLVNRHYEANVNESIAKRATPHCSRGVREAWVKAKYVQKAFVLQPADRHADSTKTRWTVRKRSRSHVASQRREDTQSLDSHTEGSSSTPGTGHATDSHIEGSSGTDNQTEGSSGTPGTGQSTDSHIEGLSSTDSHTEGSSSTPGTGQSTDSQTKGSSSTPGTGQSTTDNTADIGGSEDSGLDGTTKDVVIFGNETTHSVNLELDDSCSEEDNQSTTSYEDWRQLTPNLLLYRAAEARNLAVMLEALSLGAAPNWHNTDEDGKTPLIQAITSGSMCAVEFLLLNGAKVDVKDDRGCSPLHHASLCGHTGQICQLLKRRANQNAVDEESRTPLSIAVSKANADIVTLLRLAKLNDEMQETEGVYGGADETFNEVFKDFSQIANTTPDRLNRRK